MIQDIYPMELHNEFYQKKISDNSFVIYSDGQNILVNNFNGVIRFPQYRELGDKNKKYTYLFRIDDREFFYSDVIDEVPDGFSYENINTIRTASTKDEAFAAMTAHHLVNWYNANKFCGKCGHSLCHDAKERMMYCPACHNMIYPKISPAIIVAITDGDRILMTKYANRAYKKYSLVAGFTEIGETLEETVKREVMEEVGLKVKNIKYYKNQPWGLTGGLLVGFFAELDGSPEIKLDTNELAEGKWFRRDELWDIDYRVSITNEMMQYFKMGGKL